MAAIGAFKGGLRAVACAALLIGCARYHPAPLSSEQGAVVLEGRRLDVPGLRAFAEANLGRKLDTWPPAEWDLDALTLVAFYFHPDLEVARTVWRVARAQQVTAGARQNPDLSVEGARVTHSEDQSPWVLGFSLEGTVITAGKRGHRIAAARARSEAARLGVAEAAWPVRQRVRESLLDAWDALGRLERGARREEAQTEIVAMMEKRLEVGEAAQPDVTRERLTLARLRVDLRQAERDHARARAAVAAAVSVPAEALHDVRLSFAGLDSEPEPIGAGVRKQALLGRADVVRLLAEYEASERALRLEIARQYPDLRLAPGFTYEQGERHFVVGLALPLPIFDRNRGPIAEAEARRQEVAARFRALQARVMGETDTALAEVASADRALAAASTVLARLQQSRQETESSFQAGAIDRLALRTADLELAEADEARFRALVERQRTQGRLEDAIQRPLTGALSRLPSAERRPE